MTEFAILMIFRPDSPRLGRAILFWTVILSAAGGVLRASDTLRANDIVAICGDSLTEQRLYSAFIETYLLACQPVKDVHTHQFGLSGETSWDFVTRIESDVLRFDPTVATTFYGMNDGGYSPIDPARQASYRRGTTQIVQKLKAGGVRFIVIGSPGAVDTDSFNRYALSGINAERYNTQTLADLAEIARQVAAEQGVTYADIHGLFSEVMAKAKAKYGPGYHVGGADGVHPAANGHLIVAYAFLKALGCNGDIGTIKVDLTGNRITASEGHRVLSFINDAIKIESVRYPFCFYGDPGDPDGTRGILEFLPFNAELNRFRLVVTGVPTSQLKVTWGKASKIFSANELAGGVNLAAEFPDNPFSEPFKVVESAVRKQQESETLGIRNVLNSLIGWTRVPPEEHATPDKLADRVVKKARALEAAARAAVKPVEHSLKIERVP